MSSIGDPWQSDRARPIGDVIKRLLKRKRFYEKGKFGALVHAWAHVVGDEIAAHTRISGFREGRLVVDVDSSVLLHELGGFLKEQVLRELQATDGGVDVMELRFRLGSAGHSSARRSPSEDR